MSVVKECERKNLRITKLSNWFLPNNLIDAPPPDKLVIKLVIVVLPVEKGEKLKQQE